MGNTGKDHITCLKLKRQDMSRYVKICQDMSRYICQDMSRYVKICQDIYVKICQDICPAMSSYVKICQDMSRYVKICQDMSRHVKTWQDMSRHVKICQDMSSCHNTLVDWNRMAVPINFLQRVFGPRTVSQVSTRWQVQTHDTRMGWQQGSVDLGSQGLNSSWNSRAGLTFFGDGWDGFPLATVGLRWNQSTSIKSSLHYVQMDLAREKTSLAVQRWDTGSFLRPSNTPSPTVTQPSQLGSQRQNWRGCRCMAARSHPTPVSLPCFRQSYIACSVVEDELFDGYMM